VTKLATVYILSGPAGVGKSTTANALAKALPSSSLISGDVVSWMHKNGREKPWLSEKEVALIWDNILSIAKNFLARDIDVVIDYVTFPKQAEWFAKSVQSFNCEVRYVVFMCDAQTLIERDRQRAPAYQMGNRCLELSKEFKTASTNPQHIFDTTNLNPDDLPYILYNIKKNEQYKIHNGVTAYVHKN
jgi:adenylate kinase family enzyme